MKRPWKMKQCVEKDKEHRGARCVHGEASWERILQPRMIPHGLVMNYLAESFLSPPTTHNCEQSYHGCFKSQKCLLFTLNPTLLLPRNSK